MIKDVDKGTHHPCYKTILISAIGVETLLDLKRRLEKTENSARVESKFFVRPFKKWH